MRRCMGCMKEYEDELIMCPHCGYAEGMARANEECLQPSTILQGRYIVGRKLCESEAGIRYIGFDALLERRVFLHEVENRNQIFQIKDEIADEFQETTGIYMVTDYREEIFQKYSAEPIIENNSIEVYPMGDYPAEEYPREDYAIEQLEAESDKNSEKNKTTILIIVSIVICILLLLLLVFVMNPIDRETESIETEISEDEIASKEVIQEDEVVLEEVVSDEVVLEEDASSGEILPEEEIVSEEEIVATLDLSNFVDTIGGEDVMEFLIANFWKEVNYGTGTVEGEIQNISSDIYESSINSNVATQILKETMNDESMLLEGVITVLVSKYEGDYILAPYWFTYEINQEGEYTVRYEEVENTASKVTASYELVDAYGTYSIENALDGKATTTWSPQSAEGHYALFEYSEDVEIYGVLLLNGYWKSSDTYSKNGRLTNIEICTDDYVVGAFNLNTASYNSDIADEGIYNYMLLFDEPVTASELYILLTGSIDGTKYEDVCISEILVIAR